MAVSQYEVLGKYNRYKGLRSETFVTNQLRLMSRR